MNKNLICLLAFILGMTFYIQSANALETYVGVEILNLTDDPSGSCAGEPGYGSQGRIRAFSSIVGDEYTNQFPIYFELRDASDNSLVWSGNSTKDTDYTIGDIIYLPQPVDLTPGSNYTLFFDIDAIRIYLPLENYNEFEASADNNYWTAGVLNEESESEYSQYSSKDSCSTTPSFEDNYYAYGILVGNNRDLNVSCGSDGIEYNCHEVQTMNLIVRYGGSFDGRYTDFNARTKYDNLHQPDVGNFEFGFTFN